MLGDAGSIKNHLLQELDADRLVLPTLPEVALKAREAANDPDTDIPTLQEMVGSDAALSTRVVKVANSPLVRGVSRIDDLPTALSRLGVTYSCNLVIGLAMEQMFQATNAAIDQMLREVWSRSAEVAAIANVLARHYSDLEPDKATLAGLTHLIGVLPILSYAEENVDNLSEEEIANLESVIQEISPGIGKHILEHWEFPQAIAAIPEAHLDFMRQSEHLDLTDIVIAARIQSYGYPGLSADQGQASEIPAMSKLGLSTDGESLELSELSEEISDAVEVLH